MNGENEGPVKGVQLWTIEARRWSWRRERPHEARDGANGAQARAEHTIAATSSAHAVCGGEAQHTPFAAEQHFSALGTGSEPGLSLSTETERACVAHQT